MSGKVKQFIYWMIALAVTAVIVVLAMGGFQQISFQVRSSGTVSVTEDEALKRLGETEAILFEADLNRNPLNTLIHADEEIVGVMTETRDFETFAFRIGDGEEIQVEPYDGEALIEELDTAGGYIFYDGQDQVIGYAQETFRRLPQGDERYVHLLYDADLNVSQYYLDTERQQIYTMKGILLVKGTCEYNPRNHISQVKLVCKDDGEVDTMHKLLLAACMEDSAYREYM